MTRHIEHTVETKQIGNRRIVFVRIPNVPYSILTQIYHVGSRHDPKKQQGLAHMVEHLYAPSISDGVTWVRRMNFLEEHGIEFEARTTKEYTAYTYTQPSYETHTALKLLLQDAGVPHFKKEKFNISAEKSAIVRELKNESSDIDVRMSNSTNNALWPSSTIAHPIAGTIESVTTIDATSIKNFVDKYYNTGTQDILIIGNIQIDKLLELLTASLSATKLNNNKKTTESFVPPIPYILDNTITLGDSVHIGVYYRTVPANDIATSMCLSLFSDMLAGSWSSRLNQVLRSERGLTYWVTNYRAVFSDTGSLGFEFSVNNSDAPQALKLTLSEIDSMSARQFSQQDIMRIIQARTAEIVRKSHNIQMLLGWYLEETLHTNKITDFNAYLTLLSKMSSERLTDVVQKYLIPENRSIVILGTPNTKIQKEINSMLR